MTDFGNDITPPSAAQPSQVCVNTNLRASFLQDIVSVYRSCEQPGVEYSRFICTCTHPAKQK